MPWGIPNSFSLSNYHISSHIVLSNTAGHILKTVYDWILIQVNSRCQCQTSKANIQSNFNKCAHTHTLTLSNVLIQSWTMTLTIEMDIVTTNPWYNKCFTNWIIKHHPFGQYWYSLDLIYVTLKSIFCTCFEYKQTNLNNKIYFKAGILQRTNFRQIRTKLGMINFAFAYYMQELQSMWFSCYFKFLKKLSELWQYKFYWQTSVH
jgi:hypothetical protein